MRVTDVPGTQHSKGLNANARQRKRTMTSAQVFSLFIEADENGKESGDNILSRECFALWLISRNKTVKHPEESFRRTLIAHIRGVYGRKPFSKHVEASLLAVLRATKKDGKDFDPWERCFPGNALHIGKRGFNKKGFHEEQEFKNIKSESTQEPVLKKSRSASVESPGDIDSEKSVIDSSANNKTYIGFTEGNHQVRMLYEVSMTSDKHFGWLKQVGEALTSRYSFEELSAIMKRVKEAGFDLMSPTFQFYLKQVNPFDSMNLTLLYIFPANDKNAMFDVNKLSGRILFNLKTWVISDEDSATINLLQRSIKSLHIFDIVESPSEWLILFPKFLKLIELNAFAWMRLKILKGDALVGIFLLKIQLRNDDYCIITLQDQSEYFPGLLQVRRLA